MRYLGIDFGTKHIGLSVSSDEGNFAFPLKVIENNKETLQELQKIIEERAIETIVLGDPGTGQSVVATHEAVVEFKEKIERLGYGVVLQDESMTSLHADLFGNKKPIAQTRGNVRKEKKDESAAALILQRYLDKKHHD